MRTVCNSLPLLVLQTVCNSLSLHVLRIVCNSLALLVLWTVCNSLTLHVLRTVCNSLALHVLRTVCNSLALLVLRTVCCIFVKDSYKQANMFVLLELLCHTLFIIDDVFAISRYYKITVIRYNYVPKLIDLNQ